MEGGVISIFIKKKLERKRLLVFGSGEQTRDFLFVEDCADFIVRAGLSKKATGKIINAGRGRDIKIKDLALKIAGNKKQIKFVKHHHLQAEIPKLLCNNSLAKKLLNWKPKNSFYHDLKKTIEWIEENG